MKFLIILSLDLRFWVKCDGTVDPGFLYGPSPFCLPRMLFSGPWGPRPCLPAPPHPCLATTVIFCPGVLIGGTVPWTWLQVWGGSWSDTYSPPAPEDLRVQLPPAVLRQGWHGWPAQNLNTWWRHKCVPVWRLQSLEVTWPLWLGVVDSDLLKGENDLPKPSWALHFYFAWGPQIMLPTLPQGSLFQYLRGPQGLRFCFILSLPPGFPLPIVLACFLLFIQSSILMPSWHHHPHCQPSLVSPSYLCLQYSMQPVPPTPALALVLLTSLGLRFLFIMGAGVDEAPSSSAFQSVIPYVWVSTLSKSLQDETSTFRSLCLSSCLCAQHITNTWQMWIELWIVSL